MWVRGGVFVVGMLAVGLIWFQVLSNALQPRPMLSDRALAPQTSAETEAPTTWGLNRTFFEMGLLNSPNGGDALYRLIKAHDASAFDAMVTEMAAKLEWGGSQAEVEAIGIAHLKALRLRLAPQLDHAPADLLHQAVERYVAVIANFGDDKLCTQYIYRGAAALSRDQINEHGRALLATNTALMRALFAGAEAPVERAAPLASEMGDLFDEWVVATDSVAQIEVIARQDPDDPAACAAFLAFFRYLQSAPHDKAERVRILLLRELAMN